MNIENLNRVQRLSKNIYLLDYRHDYSIDELMERGISSAAELFTYATRKMLGAPLKSSGKEPPLACSAFEAHNENGEHIMGRNFDYMDAPCYVVWTHPKDAYAALSMTDATFLLTLDSMDPSPGYHKRAMLAPYFALDGINEKGLAIAVLQIHEKGTKQSTGKKPMFTTAMIRCCLDKCADVDEAIEMFRRFDIRDTVIMGYSLGCCFHYMLTDARGNSAVIEYVNNEMRVLRRSEPLFVTNYYLSPDGGSDAYDPEGMERCDMIADALREHNNIMSHDDTFRLLSDIHLNYRHKNNLYDITTLWSCLYNNDRRSMSLAARMDYSRVFSFSVDEPLCVHDECSVETTTPLEGIGLR